MQKIFYIFFLVGLINLFSNHSSAMEIVGGELTWECQGNGDYIFELKLFRDCNGDDADLTTKTVQVWGHPNVTSVQLNFIERNDLSPMCTASSGATPLLCGSGNSGGNGIGSIEEVVFRSSPTSITGIPPESGWKFTYQDEARSSIITNIANPTNHGITLVATMYPHSGSSASGCMDSSPTFLQSPYFISCSQDSFEFNPNIVDTDLDSLRFSWGQLYDNFTSGAYSPPTNPELIEYASGYNYNNPTPDNSFNSNNIPASIHPTKGIISFSSQTTGAFATKIVVDSYRKGVKIATVEQEVAFIVTDCNGTNNAPQITPPFDGNTSFETSILAGNFITFDILAKDLEMLQDGTPQSVTITASGSMFGANFINSNSGCSTPPCATLDVPSVTNINGANMTFEWQTTCDHLIGTDGEAKEVVPYNFVFKVQDDYCPIPKVEYVTVTINVLNEDVLPPPEIQCISTTATGDIVIEWNPITDPFGTFAGYEVNGVNTGMIDVVADINNDTYTIPGGIGGADAFFISTLSGCNGNTRRHSDTLSNIYLDLNNPGNGEAVLQWNKPTPNPPSTFDDHYKIYKEYPSGIWSLLATVPYSTTNYKDTITICKDFINYQVVLSTDFCDFNSNIEGDIFEDNIVPDIPEITNVDIDTLSGDITLFWTENTQQDTYGYVVYQTDNNGNLVEIDTVWGINNTSYTHYQNPYEGPFEYSVAAFDSCYTSNVPPTYQTSAKAFPHTTNFLSTSLNVCDRELLLNWTGYIGFDSIQNYLIYAKFNENDWEQVGETTDDFFNLDVTVGDQLLVVVQAVSDQGITSFSNVDTLSFSGSIEPEFSYLSVATVSNDGVIIKHRVSLDDGVKLVELERFNTRIQEFEKIDEEFVGNQEEIVFFDEDAESEKRSYTYRTKIIDTCGQFLGYSNIGRTIHLNIITDDVNEIHTLQWTPYEDFIGNIYRYEVFRAIDGEYEASPIAILPYNKRTYTDDVSAIGDYDDGRICYLVMAREGSNEYGLEEKSYSNEACGFIEPLIYIPNAFTVGGENPIFKPVTRQHQLEKYLFEIYDRYGGVIFSTTDPDEGWDGRVKSQILGKMRVAKENVYIYRLTLRDGNGIETVKYGHVTLLNAQVEIE